MACACQSKREQFEVVTKGGEGKIVFTSGSQPTAKTVAGRYPGSVVRSKKSGDIVHRQPNLNTVTPAG